jgi:hypothetical protein
MSIRLLNRTIDDLFVRARMTSGMTQREFGAALGASHRTAERWDARQSTPSVSTVCKAAVLVFPRDPALARELAAAASETLESLGLVEPPPPPAPLPPPPPRPPLALLVDAVVTAAADATHVAPAEARTTLLAGLRRMKELGVTADEMEGALETAQNVRRTPTVPSPTSSVVAGPAAGGRAKK